MIGTILNNRYELLEKIGEGGMAEVYKAKCHKLNRYDAVKILKRDYANDPAVVDKFKIEATAVANLSDNNIINIFDVGSQGDINYIVMEYVKGKTLKQIIKENVRLSYERAIDIAIQIAKALDCAHRNNIIHRDVKPQNIMVTDEGVVKVTDFGIAKASSNVTITNSNKVIGSAHYFSPEQARGNFVDARTDIYSLGIVLYEMVTGKLPFDAESPVTIALKHLQDDAIPPKHLNSSIPESLNALIMKCIQKDPNNRYQTVRELLMDLLRIQKDLNYEIIPSSVEKEHTRIMEPVNIPHTDEEFDDEPKVNITTKKILLFALAGILVVALGALSAWAVFGGTNKAPNTNKPDRTSEEVLVPNVIGKTEAEAKAEIEALGLEFEVRDDDYDDEIPAGSVIKTFPAAGEKAPNNVVGVRLSKGPRKNTVPSVLDYDVEQAKIILQNLNFELVIADKQYNDTVPKNFIISQTPTADTEAEKGTKVQVVVSLGPEVVFSTVPDLKGKTVQEAEALLTTAKLKLGSKTEVPTKDQTLVDKIAEQNIAANTKVEEGAVIDIKYYVLEEDKTVIVPNLMGKTIEEAETILAEFKLKMGTQEAVPTDIDEDNGKIFEWSPAGGTSVEEGTAINIKYYEKQEE
ncbi:Stk1 family PASTA domain-containing Ser/Thr kinase [Clostridium thermarum]|uniref:Stk1 family PASTA domain-containing Ser/Thr kinase n=1 Tax=Clostridium thermarum TaxID=1716543 RepID=UPI0013D4240F|nr:Stk1 family PASTA domain-containing Ser/Thr kinase [Clostridium thermarum]